MKTTALAFALAWTLVACRNHASRVDNVTRAETMDPCVTDADCRTGLTCIAGVCVPPVDPAISDSGNPPPRIGAASPTPADSAVGAEISDVARGCRCGSFAPRGRRGLWFVGLALTLAWRRRHR